MNDSRVLLVGEDAALLRDGIERRGFAVETVSERDTAFDALDETVGGVVVDGICTRGQRADNDGAHDAATTSDADAAADCDAEFISKVRDYVGPVPVYVLVDDSERATATAVRGGGIGIERSAVADDTAALAARLERAMEFSQWAATSREGDSLYRLIVEQSNDAIFIGQDADFQFWNRRLTELTGLNDDELAASAVLDVIHPDDRQKVADISDRRRRGEDVPTNYNVRVVDTDGDVHECSVTVQDIHYHGEYGVLVTMRDVTEQRATEARFQSLIELARDVVTLVGTDGRVKYQSPSVESVLGFDQDELVGKHIEELVHPDDRAVVLSAYEESLQTETGTKEPIRYRHRGADGSWRWMESMATNQADTVVDGFVVTSRDVTEQRTYERRLQRYETIVESIHQGAYVADADRTIRYINEAAADRVGVSPETLVGEHISVTKDYGLLDDDQYAQIDAALDDILSGESTGERLELSLSSSTVERVVEFTVTPITDDAGGVTGAVGLSSDITERKRYEERLNALHVSTRRLSAATSKTAVAEVVCDAAVEVLDYELSGVLLYDDSRDALVPTAFTERAMHEFGEVPPLPRGTGLSWEVFESQELCLYDDVESNPQRYNPDTDIAEELVVPIPDYGVFFVGSLESGELADQRVTLARVLASNTRAALDRVEREQLLRRREQELARQNEQLESFASVVSHDLQNPLNVATGYLELAREQHDSDELQRVADAHDRIASIIQDVLTLARNGQTIDEVELLSLDAVATEAWDIAAANTPDATLDVEGSEDVRAHRGRLRQLLENLVSNAIRHGGDDVTVRIGPLEDRVGFYVADDGPGVPESARPRIFEAGFTTSTDGTGIGLSIVQSVINAHGWSIWFDESRDGGARFEITTEDES
ncbi:PAS domain S-box protein [Haloferax profundi]|uniref:histidine kinase n=1 Tax=Haloferax profundi TaxID=1544718 RepID=A0A0W1SW50_9EURY|nr:PAS domain S-box protein [Haloferax profundi]KTG30609.1 two-component system sensor histidine kinase/response regulator [Haloferax profundi]